MSLDKSNKQKNMVRRFKTKNKRKENDIVQAVPLQDEVIVDIVLQRLFNHGNKQTASLADDIFVPLNIEFTEAGHNRIWDLLISTNLVAPVIGFGRSGRLAITKEGFQLMNQYGSYRNFIQLRAAAQQQKASATQPQFDTAKVENENLKPQTEEGTESEESSTAAGKIEPKKN